MQFEIDADLTAGDNSARQQVHVGSAEFKHLEAYDMNKICQRVCITGFKP
jgi:hypothetical protein